MPPGINRLPPGAQQPSTGNDHLSPPSLLVALGALERAADGEYVLGPDPFDLDPCTSYRQPWPTARTMWAEDTDGMSQDWSMHGEVWGNFPYGTQMPAWLARLAAHGAGLALLYARTDTNAFHAHVWGKADAVFFFRQRPFFHAPVTGIQYAANCGGPMVLAAYGAKSVERCRRLLAPDSPYPGNLVPVRHDPPARVVRVSPSRPRTRKRRSAP